jgi:hypothetical protein
MLLPQIKTYDEMLGFESFEERLQYLYLGDNNLTSPKDISAYLYDSAEWRRTREEIKLRDQGFEMGVFGIWIEGRTLVHHINPVTRQDILEFMNGTYVDKLFNPNNLISVSYDTHNKIHYRADNKIPVLLERHPGDQNLW